MKPVRAVALLFASTLAAQAPIPVRTVGPILAAGTENVGTSVVVRALSDGRVIVGSWRRWRVFAFDSTLAKSTVVIDSVWGTGSSSPPTTPIAYRGDSTVLADFGGSALLVLDPKGTIVRSMAPVRRDDLRRMNSPGVRFDRRERIVFQEATNLARPTQPPDTSPLVRADLDARTIDTVGWLKAGNELWVRTDPSTRLTHEIFNPFPWTDQWAMLTDGTIAIVRAGDYHIDWIDPDGTRRSTAKMPFDWRRITEAEKRQIGDSLLKLRTEQIAHRVTPPSGRGGGRAPTPLRTVVELTPESGWPSYWPSMNYAAVKSDLENHLWILPSTSLNAASGLTYDVVNRDGKIVERVQLPRNRALAGFGPGGMIYTTHTVGDVTTLERAQVR